jgi:hypothetical protein
VLAGHTTALVQTAAMSLTRTTAVSHAWVQRRVDALVPGDSLSLASRITASAWAAWWWGGPGKKHDRRELCQYVASRCITQTHTLLLRQARQSNKRASSKLAENSWCLRPRFSGFSPFTD